jgi:hypothetical protein
MALVLYPAHSQAREIHRSFHSLNWQGRLKDQFDSNHIPQVGRQQGCVDGCIHSRRDQKETSCTEPNNPQKTTQ